jgi:hypothetical protein
MLHKDFKKDTINDFRIKYWISTPVWVNFQEHGNSFYVNIEEKVWLFVEKYWQRLTKTLPFQWETELSPNSF